MKKKERERERKQSVSCAFLQRGTTKAFDLYATYAHVLVQTKMS